MAIPDYMSKQTDINSSMRTILIDWLVEVQENFELFHETLYIAVRLVDTYLSRKDIKREYLQLVGATCMLIAAKFEVFGQHLSLSLSLFLSLSLSLSLSLKHLFSFISLGAMSFSLSLFQTFILFHFPRSYVLHWWMISSTCVMMPTHEMTCSEWREIF